MSQTVAGVLKAAQKKHGSGIGGRGLVLPEVERLPIGILAFDIASGGGIPLSRMSIVYGPESSGKTNFVLTCVAAFQQQYPDLVCVFIDIEQTLTTDWAETLGVNVDELVIIRPDYSEQIVDIVEDLLQSHDCGLIVLDSIAAMTTMQELSNSAEKEAPGTQARSVSKMVRKCVTALGEAQKGGRCPTLLWVNQTRTNIGQMFGNPETLPGGLAQKFMAALQVRLAGKNISDSSVSKVMPVIKQSSGVIKKWKQPICSTNFRYQMVMLGHDDHVPGECKDWELIKLYATKFGWIKKGKGYMWQMGGQEAGPFGTHAELYAHLRAENMIEEFRDTVIEILKEDPTQGQALEK